MKKEAEEFFTEENLKKVYNQFRMARDAFRFVQGAIDYAEETSDITEVEVKALYSLNDKLYMENRD